MALSHGKALQCFWIIWLFYRLLGEASSRETETFYLYLEGSHPECETQTHVITGATIYSHHGRHQGIMYADNIDCCITFQAPRNWTLMLRLVDLDIPDKSMADMCNDVLYVYDANSYVGQALEGAGGPRGLCGNRLPSTLFSSGRFLTICFRTDNNGPRGEGFKLILTAFHQDQDDVDGCKSGFGCSNRRCIDPDLTCDHVDHCGDGSDEQTVGGPLCGQTDDSLLGRLLSLGITAAIAITVGSVAVFIVCVVCIICCCCRCLKKQNQDPGGGGAATTTTATSVSINNGVPPPHLGQPGYQPNHAYNHQGYYPMHQVRGPGSTQGSGSVVRSGPASVHSVPGSVHGSVHTQPVPYHHSAHTYSPFPAQRESYSQGSAYSSQPPPSYHRSHTPTSSRSGKSHHSGESGVRYQVQLDRDKVSLPAHL